MASHGSLGTSLVRHGRAVAMRCSSDPSVHTVLDSGRRVSNSTLHRAQRRGSWLHLDPRPPCTPSSHPLCLKGQRSTLKLCASALWGSGQCVNRVIGVSPLGLGLTRHGLRSALCLHVLFFSYVHTKKQTLETIKTQWVSLEETIQAHSLFGAGCPHSFPRARVACVRVRPRDLRSHSRRPSRREPRARQPS